MASWPKRATKGQPCPGAEDRGASVRARVMMVARVTPRMRRHPTSLQRTRDAGLAFVGEPHVRGRRHGAHVREDMLDTGVLTVRDALRDLVTHAERIR